MTRYSFSFKQWQSQHNELILGFYEIQHEDTPDEIYIFLEPDNRGNLRISPDFNYLIKTNKGTWYVIQSIPYKIVSTDPTEEVEDLQKLKEQYA